MNKTENFIYDDNIHNLKAPNIIVPYLVKKLKPQSVVDIGCGIGAFLHVFKREGVRIVRGYDGDWVDRKKLFNFIDENEFIPVDLEKRIESDVRFDMAVSLEVAEHINEKNADTFIENLTNLSDIIVFSAAVPGQMGQGHINEQWPDYWQDKFSNYGYQFYDVLRPVFWMEEDISPWHKQNMFLILKKNKKGIKEKFISDPENKIWRIVHPSEYIAKVNTMLKFQNRYNGCNNNLRMIEKGKKPLNYYVKLLLKSILFRLKLVK